MRKITKEAAEALKQGKAYRLSNTSVEFLHGMRGMMLHGNHIASYNAQTGELLIRDAGRQTNTTKERLNGILDAFNAGGIFQKNWKRYYTNKNGKTEAFEGELVINTRA